MLGHNRKHQAEIIGIGKEDIDKNIWHKTEGKRRVETQNMKNWKK